MIRFDDVTFGWGSGSEEADPEPLFEGLSTELPGKLTFVVGPNGIGKSTMMLLAAARLFPEAGSVTIDGRDTREFGADELGGQTEEERNRLVSVVYQNMEFETEEPIGSLLDIVAAAGEDPARGRDALERAIVACELDRLRTSRMQELSKGEMQRAILAMSLAYGSRYLFLDEPLFAVEPARAERIMAHLADRAAEPDGPTIYASVHDIRLARSYGTNAILFDSEGTVSVGPADELLSRTRVEQAFRAPYDTLYERQNLYRQMLRGEGEPAAGDSD